MIGADGLHSSVRRLAFGPEAQFEAIWVTPWLPSRFRLSPARRRCLFDVWEPGRMLGRFTCTTNRTLFLFVFAACDTDLPITPKTQGAAAESLWRRKVGVRKHPVRARAGRRTLFRQRQPDQIAELVKRACRACRRCGLLCLIVGRTGLGAGNDRGLCAGRRAQRYRRQFRRHLRIMRLACAATSRRSSAAPSALPGLSRRKTRRGSISATWS